MTTTGVGWQEALGSHATNPANPRTSGFTISGLGKKWTVASLENALKAQFEGWVRDGAMDTIRNLANVDPEMAAEFKSVFMADMGAGHYRWNGKAIRKALQDYNGVCYLLYLLMRRCHPNVTEEEVAKIFKENHLECGAALAWALGNSSTPSNQPTGEKNQETLDS